MTVLIHDLLFLNEEYDANVLNSCNVSPPRPPSYTPSLCLKTL